MPHIEIQVKGHIDQHWSDWFGGLTITHTEQGNTVLTGPVRDQAALYGLLSRLRDLGLQLVSVNHTGTNVEKRLKTDKEVLICCRLGYEPLIYEK